MTSISCGIVICVAFTVIVKGAEVGFSIIDDVYDNILLSTFGINVSNVKELQFRVKGCHDAHLNLLASTSHALAPFYRIHLGAYNNTRSTVSTVNDSIHEVDAFDAIIMDCGAFTEFQITWFDGKIQVGRLNPFNDIILSLEDSCPFQVEDIEISTMFGATVDWVVTVPSPTVPSIHAVVAGMFIEKENCPTFSLIDVLTGQQIISCAQCCIARPECAAFRFLNDVCELVSAVAKSYNTATYFKMN
ncbi:Hypothetical predicted protein [Mytilus galloprovincialis]|uniref:Farnesoic acid O-methyl transferase domain-containing protein n=1 Tax=Mytilus galloprovincialis TaxID=29158 RepID=A0A8B6GTJ9_MYTGA|nr:Hypothetical predicted protein [Mytilus galloprovincialis]VDI68847.1 Hypothetical predicted protein [Mytilus galloprovincialis]